MITKNTNGLSRYDDVWRTAEPYLRARKNDVHIPLSFDWAQRLLEEHPGADRDIVSLAILLHDIGWYSIDMGDIIEKGFGPNMMQSDVRFLHEIEGVRLSRPVLEKCGWGEDVFRIRLTWSAPLLSFRGLLAARGSRHSGLYFLAA